MLGIAAVPAILQLVGMLFLPETPIYLYKTDKTEEGDRVLRCLYKPEHVTAKKNEM